MSTLDTNTATSSRPVLPPPAPARVSDELEDGLRGDGEAALKLLF